MSFDGASDGVENSPTPDLLAALRRLGGSSQPQDPIAQLRAMIAQDARLPPTGGLFGSGYARYMAENAPSLPLNVLAPSSAGGFPPSPALFPAATAPSASAQPPSPGPAAATAAGPQLTTSPQGRAFIRNYELNSATQQPYFDIAPDVSHNPTFGYGHKVQPGEQAALQARIRGLDHQGRAALIEQMYDQDLAAKEQLVRDRLGPEALATLTQPQFDAIVADAFNAGSGGALGHNMLQNIWDGDMTSAGKQFNAVTSTDTKTGKSAVIGGLVKRNLQEAAIFNRGDYNYQPTQQEMDALKRAGQAALAGRATKR